MNRIADPSSFSPALKPILIILHQETSSPGRVGRQLMRRGYTLDIRKPRFGDTLPETMDNHAGAVIFGGPMSANDPDDFVKAETNWISVPLDEGRPFLGICLGAQMLARTLGAEVSEHPDELVEIGYYDLEATEAGRDVMEWPETVYQWHREGFDMPSGAVHLARSTAFENQAFRYGPSAYGIQFHSELTLAMMCKWTVHGAPRFEMKGAQERRQHMDGRLLHDAPVQTWLGNFLDIWIASDRQAQSWQGGDDSFQCGQKVV